MKRNIIVLLLVGLVLTSCQNDEFKTENADLVEQQQDPLTTKQINEEINKILTTGKKFYWRDASHHLLWSAVMQGNQLVSIGFGESYDRARVPNHAQIEQKIINLIEKYEGKKAQVIMQSDEILTQMDVFVEKKETLIALRQLTDIRYIEPADYRYFSVEQERNPMYEKSSSSSGCGYDTATLNALDYTTVAPSAKVPWSFAKHKITDAWAYATGAGVTVGIIDTGTSTQQSLLSASFNNGSSSGRSITKKGVYVDSIWPWSTGYDGSDDKCGHGTSMAAALAAPRNNQGMPVGVAYNANLITYRAASNVVLDGYHEQNGVKTAFTELGNTASVKIISMSMGHVFSVGKIEDGVKYAYNKGKLIFSAGGTSTSFTTFVGVIFPAWMDEIQAVTGVKENTSNQKCDVCHSGSEIDFTYQMQRSSGNTIPVLSYYNANTDYVGGSSVATASTAGIAALVWSKNPSWTRTQVINKLRQSATYYPSKNSSYGYGNIDVLKAVQ